MHVSMMGWALLKKELKGANKLSVISIVVSSLSLFVAIAAILITIHWGQGG